MEISSAILTRSRGWVRPIAHQFFAHAVPWEHIRDNDLPRFDKHLPREQASPAVRARS